MKIRLSDITRDGSFWHLERGQEEDLDLSLEDLLGGEESYTVELSINPLDQSGTYHLSGSIRTQWKESCSRCADDFTFRINQAFHEILIPKLDMPRKGSTSKPQHIEHTSTPEDSEAYEYENNIFHLGDFLHEIIALSRPLAPQPEADDKGSCSLCFKNHDQILSLFKPEEEESMPVIRPSPFDVLKNLKN